MNSNVNSNGTSTTALGLYNGVGPATEEIENLIVVENVFVCVGATSFVLRCIVCVGATLFVLRFN